MKMKVNENSKIFEKSKNCLNCNENLTGKFCSNCGQKSNTHRITFRNFLEHDVLHGTLHFEKGMLFTAKEALTRPGKSALDYIYGKRKRYYNVFLLILIIIGIMLFIRHYYINSVSSINDLNIKEYLNEASRKMDEIISNYNKYIILLFVPFSALNTFVLFRRKNLNLSEHFIISGMILLGILLYSLLGNLLFFFDILIPFSNSIENIISLSITILIFLHIIYGIYDAFESDYTKLGVSYRIFLYFILIFLEILVLLFFFCLWNSYKLGIWRNCFLTI